MDKIFNELGKMSDSKLAKLKAAINKEQKDRKRLVWYRWGVTSSTDKPRWSQETYKGALKDRDFEEWLKPKRGSMIQSNVTKKPKAKPRNNRDDVWLYDCPKNLSEDELNEIYEKQRGRALSDVFGDI